MSDLKIKNVMDTAKWVAVYRAEESKRPDALFKDPFAENLAGAEGKAIATSMSTSLYTSWNVVMRTCIIDDFILERIASGIDTVINLGAGLDARPYRMKLPSSLKWIEVDFETMINYKTTALQAEKPNCNLMRIGLDLSHSGERKKLFEKLSGESKSALILTEGVIPYLENQAVAELAKDIRAQKNFHFWILDYFSPELMKYMRSGKRIKQMKNAPFVFSPPEWFSYFKGVGWRAREIRYIGEESVRRGRKIPRPKLVSILVFIFGNRALKRLLRLSGYVLLEPS